MNERATAAARAIINDLRNRRGFRHTWDSCDTGVCDEIERAWTLIIAALDATTVETCALAAERWLLARAEEHFVDSGRPCHSTSHEMTSAGIFPEKVADAIRAAMC